MRGARGAMSYLRKVLAIAVKDLRSEARARELTPAMLVFSLIVIVIFNFAFEPGLQNRDVLAPGILWVAFAFSGMMGLVRSFAAEREQDAIRGLMLAPMDRSAIYLGKLLSNLIFLLGVEAVGLLAFGIFFNIDIFPFLPGLSVVLVLATLGFVAVGTLYAAMASNIRLREILLPILLFPVIVPVLIAAVKATGGVLKGQPLSDVRSWLNLLVVYDGIFTVVGVLTFEYVVGE
ncbi:MAG: heme exporter protein CcmB [bacterium]